MSRHLVGRPRERLTKESTLTQRWWTSTARGPVGTSRSGRLTRSRRAAVRALEISEEFVLVGEARKRAVGDLGPGRLDGGSHGLVTHFGPPFVERGVSVELSDMATRVDRPPATKATTT